MNPSNCVTIYADSIPLERASSSNYLTTTFTATGKQLDVSPAILIVLEARDSAPYERMHPTAPFAEEDEFYTVLLHTDRSNRLA